ncbi:conserved hypothetical protein [Talaromyces stipitatus ATCC 10500]|uniref:DDE-1 domain-containing protein n=1 Tax=Talaromyces stipitatus (strain ATCC 10500 / CBS 375.48 / QM 6759 / NRRL 1006) TaxID=441959 RepID=B8M4F0_TALSN|nr:uncharacterized protein TSTA_024670 [Talaromyces stipitatus ATCC 10500]EED19145.1 conserved hypothetical protein [Talaromyces stipitatus ATCC 10500]
MAKSGNIQDSWLQDFDPQEQRCFFAASDSGWTNNELGYRWLVDVFDKETKSQASRGWRLLILDGHGSDVNMRFIEYCDKNRILLAIFPAHAIHTLQPLDVALFAPLSKAYTKELRKFIDDCQGLSRLSKRDFFRLFWASWKEAFISENINSAFKNTGLYPFNLELVIHRFTPESESRRSSSDSAASITKVDGCRRIRKLVREVVTDIYDKKAQKLNDTMLHLSTENILLKTQVEGLQRALITAKKCPNKEKSLLLDLPTQNEGGAIFFSPPKVQQARDLQLQKDEDAAHEQARKDNKKLQQQLTKQAKELEKAEKAQIWQQQREQRQQEAAEKQRFKDKQELAKLADLQLQKDILETKRFIKGPADSAPWAFSLANL